jgi:dihydroorotate dehydrogenase electron transfer subunit
VISKGDKIGIMIDQSVDIAFNRPVNHDTWLMGLKSPQMAETAKPGQFVMLRAGSGIDPLLRRPFSVAGVKDDLFMVLYRVVGKGTAIMAGAKGGERLAVLGPLGKGFDVPREGVLSVLVGGGIGVAPLFFLSQTLRARRVEFMMGFRTAKDIIQPEDDQARKHSLSVSTDDGTEGQTGFVTSLLGIFLDKNKTRSMCLFACGPRPMLKQVAEMAMVRGIPCQVSLEAAMACGLGACQGCAVKASPNGTRSYYHVCRDGPVFPIQSIDWAEHYVHNEP